MKSWWDKGENVKKDEWAGKKKKDALTGIYSGKR